MTDLSPFAKQLVAMVRQMPDEAVLELVRNHLAGGGELVASGWTGTGRAGDEDEGGGWSSNGSAIRERPASSKPKVGRAKKAPRATAADRAKLEQSVLATILASTGVSLGDVAAKLGAAKPQVAAAIRALKASGKIKQAGERRLARYAKTQTAANKASRAAQRS
jgi:biotin operon repressor